MAKHALRQPCPSISSVESSKGPESAPTPQKLWSQLMCRDSKWDAT
jgi:hypothetical protein